MISKFRAANFMLVFFLCTVPLWSQTSGSFTGTVVDESGAAVVGAQVSVGNSATGLRRKAKSNSDGNYLFAGLSAGTYDITITAPGFKKFEAKRVILRVGEKIRVDTKLDRQSDQRSCGRRKLGRQSRDRVLGTCRHDYFRTDQPTGIERP